MLKECTQCLVSMSPLNFSEYSRRCKKCELKPTYEDLEAKLTEIKEVNFAQNIQLSEAMAKLAEAEKHIKYHHELRIKELTEMNLLNAKLAEAGGVFDKWKSWQMKASELDQKLSMAIEALEKIEEYGEYSDHKDTVKIYRHANEALEKIKR